MMLACMMKTPMVREMIKTVMGILVLRTAGMMTTWK